MSPTHIN